MIDPVKNTPAVFAECPVWLAELQRLYWVDCAAGALFSLDWRSRHVSLVFSRPATLLSGLVKYGESSLLLLAGDGAWLVDGEGQASSFQLPAAIDCGLINDGKCDRAGKLWIGQVRSSSSASDGVLHRVSDGICKQPIRHLAIPNGPAFNPAGDTLYIADSLAGRVDAYTLDCDGQPSANSVLVLQDGQPDGMTVNANGDLFVALFGAGAIAHIDPVAATTEWITVPAQHPTSCAFGGPELDTLFVTVANGPWPEDRRHPGPPPPTDPDVPSLYAVSMAAAGLSEPCCHPGLASPEL